MEKPKLDNARKLRGINFIDPEDGEYKETIEKARKKLEVPEEAAVPCEMETRKRARKLRETVPRENANSHKKTKYACIVEAHESTRKRLESTPRSTCLISRNLLNQKQPSFVSDASNVSGNPQLDSVSVLGSTRKLARKKKKDQNPASCCQERNEDIPGQASCGKLQRGVACDSSGSCWKLLRGFENQFERTRLDYHNIQISDYLYVGKVFENLRKKLRLSSCTLDVKTNVLIWGLYMSTTTNSSVRLGLQDQENLVAYKNTNFEELKTFFDITLRLTVKHSFEILNVSSMIHDFSPWMRSALCHDQAHTWATAKVYVCHSEANEKWKRPEQRISTFRRARRFVWNR